MICLASGLDQRAHGQERIAVAGFEDAGEMRVDVVRKRSLLVRVTGCVADAAARSGDAGIFDWLQGSSHKDKHAAVDVSGLDLRDDVGLKFRDQFGCVHVAPIGAMS